MLHLQTLSSIFLMLLHIDCLLSSRCCIRIYQSLSISISLACATILSSSDWILLICVFKTGTFLHLCNMQWCSLPIILQQHANKPINLLTCLYFYVVYPVLAISFYAHSYLLHFNLLVMSMCISSLPIAYVFLAFMQNPKCLTADELMSDFMHVAIEEFLVVR